MSKFCKIVVLWIISKINIFMEFYLVCIHYYFKACSLDRKEAILKNTEVLHQMRRFFLKFIYP